MIKLENSQPFEIENITFDEVRGDTSPFPLVSRKVDLSHITEESVRAELEDSGYIVIPSRHSLMRTPELTAKRDILMKLVYRGEISFDLTANDTEQGLVFLSTKPDF